LAGGRITLNRLKSLEEYKHYHCSTPTKEPTHRQHPTQEDASVVVEMNPPSGLPNGNVGTTHATIVQTVRSHTHTHTHTHFPALSLPPPPLDLHAHFLTSLNLPGATSHQSNHTPHHLTDPTVCAATSCDQIAGDSVQIQEITAIWCRGLVLRRRKRGKR
jgi:hypothetical protein